MEKIKLLELFGGIGACSKTLEKLGVEYEIVDYVEIDKYAVKSFNAIHGTNFEPQDICNWNKDIQVDLIMHGSPCQDFSLAGKQAGGDEGSGTRSSLMYETIRIVKKLRPKYVIWENVKNLLSKKHIHNFEAYIEAMNSLGYVSYYKVLNAKDYGIPQNRERVYTVSIRKDLADSFKFPKEKELELLPKDMIEESVDEKYYLDEDSLKNYNREFGSKGKQLNLLEPIPTLTASMGTGGGNIPYFEFPPKQELKLKLKDMLEEEVEAKYYLSDKMIKYISSKGTGNYRNPDCKINLDVARPITTDPNKRAGTTNYFSEDFPENYDLNNGEVVRKYGLFDNEKTTHQAGSIYDENGLCPTLDTMQGGYRQPCIESVYAPKEKELFTEDGNIKRYINSDVVDEFNDGQMATTSFPNGYGHGPRTHNESISLNCVDKPSVKYNFSIRKITPKEAWRLMGFDDSDFEKARLVCSDTQLYKQAGNSIVVNVLEAILKELFKE